MLDAVAVLLSGLVTYLTRVLFLVSRRLRPPKAAERYLPLVGPAVLAAIALPGLVAPRGEISLTETVPSLVAAAVAWLVWRRTRQMMIGLLVGLALWWGVLAVLAGLGLRA